MVWKRRWRGNNLGGWERTKKRVCEIERDRDREEENWGGRNVGESVDLTPILSYLFKTHWMKRKKVYLMKFRAKIWTLLCLQLLYISLPLSLLSCHPLFLSFSCHPLFPVTLFFSHSICTPHSHSFSLSHSHLLSPACFRMPNTRLVYRSKSPSMAIAISPNIDITWGFTDLGGGWEEMG